ncbi:hypothetical protein CS063_09485 [Sporanaerobium hydrogeniformans]|uniref:Uncharacterized protein n=1 Tax=Sporanaerobium hydrogeniformans TaxID=3072179 RepID=A0AC61DCP1_9FIRM|nr:HAMP domain-containing sensor histidine kinase [Sporanaerobium hydrogeniformans]PHV70525.1 hypothetical protein CS063_09485 [Sporanaerobium hydrogeniformans]
MSKYKKMAKVAIISSILLLVAGTLYGQDVKKAKKILILESWERGWLEDNEIIRGMENVFIDEKSEVSIFKEELGGAESKLQDDDLNKGIKNYLQLKYKEIKLDLIITIDRPALEFIKEEGVEIFPQVPVLGVVKPINTEINVEDADIGMMQLSNIAHNIEFIKKNHLGLKKLYIIYKDWMDSESFRETINRYAHQYSIHIEPICLDDIEEYRFYNNNNTAMFLPGFNQKSNHQNIKYSQYIEYVKKIYKGPIYVQDKIYVGEGSVGGVVYSSYEDGIKVATEAMIMLESNTLKNLQLIEQQEKKIIDVAAAKKYGIDISSLPKDIELLNKDIAYYELDRGMLGYLIIEGIFLFIIIGYVLVISVVRVKSIDKKLKMSKDEYRILLEAMPVGVIVLQEYQIKFINREGMTVLGVEHPREIDYFKFMNMFVEKIEFQKISEDFCLIKNKIKSLDNQIKEVEVCWFMTDKEGDERTITLLLDDISYKQLFYESQEKDRIKTQIFTDLSHELKTPINILLSSIQLLDTYKEEQISRNIINKSIKVMRQNSYRLLRLVNNIIDTTRIETGYLKLYKENCNIVELIEELTLSTVEYAKANHIEVTFDTEIEELIVSIDIEKFERIMLNLLSNAIKYNKREGQIFVTIKVQDEKILITIEDTGLGIPKEKLPYIFNRFMRINKEQHTQVEGSGLGLSLVKSLVEQHEGVIQMNSTMGVGTIVTVQLPIQRVREQEIKEYHPLIRNNMSAIKIELSDLYIE